MLFGHLAADLECVYGQSGVKKVRLSGFFLPHLRRRRDSGNAGHYRLACR